MKLDLFKKQLKKKEGKKFTGMDIYSLSDSLFRPITAKFPFLYNDFDLKLRTAKIKTTELKYGSFIIFTALVTLVCSLLFTIIFGTALIGFKSAIAAGIGISFLAAGIAGAAAYFYPILLAKDRGSKLDNSLPFATIYLSTIVKSGLPPPMMFKMLSRFEHYKIAAEEAEKISDDIHILGLDMPSALSRAMKRSPSLDWTELLAGLKNSITVGGEVGRYLEEKAQGFIAEYKRKLASFSNMLSLFMEVYITIVIVGIVFFIIISSLMVSVGGVPTTTIKFIQYLIVFAGLPLISGMFILMIKSMSPWSE